MGSYNTTVRYGGWDCYSGDVQITLNGQKTVDARLVRQIEASGDMLDALKELLAVAEAHISYPCPEIDEARAAIAKAEGR